MYSNHVELFIPNYKEVTCWLPTIIKCFRALRFTQIGCYKVHSIINKSLHEDWQLSSKQEQDLASSYKEPKQIFFLGKVRYP